jgi:hypothetical protein
MTVLVSVVIKSDEIYLNFYIITDAILVAFNTYVLILVCLQYILRILNTFLI